jgi:hypothetical protein
MRYERKPSVIPGQTKRPCRRRQFLVNPLGLRNALTSFHLRISLDEPVASSEVFGRMAVDRMLAKVSTHRLRRSPGSTVTCIRRRYAPLPMSTSGSMSHLPPTLRMRG